MSHEGLDPLHCCDRAGSGDGDLHPRDGKGVTGPVDEDKIVGWQADLQADDSVPLQRRPASLGQRAQQPAVRHQPYSAHGVAPNPGALDANPSLRGPVGGLRASEGCA
jgi:hypothetical protein